MASNPESHVTFKKHFLTAIKEFLDTQIVWLKIQKNTQ
jgi:hypothetical protein